MQFSDNSCVGGGGVLRHGIRDGVIKCMHHGGVAIFILSVFVAGVVGEGSSTTSQFSLLLALCTRILINYIHTYYDLIIL